MVSNEAAGRMYTCYRASINNSPCCNSLIDFKLMTFSNDEVSTIPPRVAENPMWRHAGSDPHHNKVNHSQKAQRISE
jgi:hypothetical protein